jgi:membrane protease YdiL (CAAX protease family)
MSPSKQPPRVAFYVIAVLVAAWLWMLSFRIGFHPPDWLAVLVLMWIPSLVSIIFRLAFKEGFRDVGWRIGNGRYWVWAYVCPLAFGALSCCAAFLFHKAVLAPNLSQQSMAYAGFLKLSWLFPNSSPFSLLCQRFLSVAVIGIVCGFIFAFGEELGWRGYLLPRLVQSGWPFPILLSGLVWGIWHAPLFFLTGYAHGAVTLSLLMFTLSTILFGVFIGWLRLASGSVFVAAMAHASFNAFVQTFFGESFSADKAWFWIGDYGVFTLIPYAVLTAWLYRSGRVHAALSHWGLHDARSVTEPVST